MPPQKQLCVYWKFELNKNEWTKDVLDRADHDW